MKQWPGFRHFHTARAIGAVFAIALAASSADGQAPSMLPRPVANQLVGVVTDTAGMPLDQVDVFMPELRRRTRTTSDGRFQFDGIRKGDYDVTARRIGSIAETKRVTVGAEGATVHITLVDIAARLMPMLTTATEGGLRGTIGDTSYRALQGVEVSIVGTGKQVRTDSVGQFFIALGPGQYMLRLTRAGFAQQLIGVTIPKTEGRQMAAWLVPSGKNETPLLNNALFEMNQRLIRERGIGAKFVTQADLAEANVYGLQEYARRLAPGTITPDCIVRVVGKNGEFLLPLWTLLSSEIEFVEVYLPSGSSASKTTSMGGNPTAFRTGTSMRPGASRECGNLGIVAWLRQ